MVLIVLIVLIILIIIIHNFNNKLIDNSTSIKDYSIIEIPHFLSDNECDQIIESSKNTGLFASKVYEGSHDSYNDLHRRSEQCWLNDTDHDYIKNISDRVGFLTGTINNKKEPFQVVKYKSGGYFNPHYDACNGSEEFCKRLNKDGFRLLTVLIYLNDDYTGGETVFPNINKTVIPEKGKAVVFYNVNEQGKPIYEALHGGNPVKSGEKYICNKWVRTMLN